MKKHMILFSLAVLGCVIMLPEMMLGQPGLPSAPTQAPIDGGLALLAAAGGAYAWKKLKTLKD